MTTILKANEYVSALSSMKQDLLQVKAEAEELKEDIDGMLPEEITFDGEPGSDEDLQEMEPADKEKAEKIKTPEDAKKVLEEAKTDLSKVVDFLDGQAGMAEEEEVTASIPNKRFNEKFASDMTEFARKSDRGIADAKNAINHWSFLTRIRKVEGSIADGSIAKTVKAVKDIHRASSLFNKLFNRKEATAVPPTNSEFTGDKTLPKDPRMVEERNWKGGAERFKRDVNREKNTPNPAIDNRLNYSPEQVSPDALMYVNAKFITTKNPGDAYWEVVDSKTGKSLRTASFNNLPSTIGPKDQNGWNIFSNKNYGNRLIDHVIEYGIDRTAKIIAGKLDNVDVQSLRVLAAADKGAVRKYYSDAYGDSEYARKLTSGEGGQGGSKPVYKPEYEHPADNTQGEHTKEGPGTLSSVKPTLDKKVIEARAYATVNLAKKFASRGIIPFTKASIFKKADELMNLPEGEFKAVDNTIEQLPVTNQAALVEAHIPDTEKGIIGNEQQGVSDNKATVKTDNINTQVQGDAKIAAKTASIVPQMSNAGAGSGVPDFSKHFSTVASKLQDKGFDLNKLRKPVYRKG